MRQLPLFTPGAIPSRPTVRWHRRIERIEVCTKCGREIVVKRTVRGEVIREFFANGRCFACFRASR